MPRPGSIACLVAVLGFALAGCGGAIEPVDPPPPPKLGAEVAFPDDPARWFDFWSGEWEVENLHLTGDGWSPSGNAVARIATVAGGRAVLEQWTGDLGGGPLIGFSLRAYDPDVVRWDIWLNWHGGDPGGFFRMHGSRAGERIEQIDASGGPGPRYSFAHIRQDSCQWEEAKPNEDGTWTTTWVMRFARIGQAHTLDAGNAPIVQPPDAADRHPETRALDFLLGEWSGDGVTVRATSMIEGFGTLLFVDTDDGEATVTAAGFDTLRDGWFAVRADSGQAGIEPMRGTVRDATATFTAAGLRESWTCRSEDECTFVRASSPDGGASWNAVLTADLRR